MTAFLLLSAISCGGPDADPCASDRECPAFHRCIDRECRPLESGDAGSTRDAGASSRDAGTIPQGDASTLDASTPDAGSRVEGEGRLLVVSAESSLGVAGWVAAGEFFAEASPACTTVIEGACTYRECAATTAFASAGEIDIETPRVAVHVEPAPAGPYFAMGGASLWSEGDAVRFTASGGAAPAFDLEAPVPMTGGVTEATFGGARLGDLFLARHLSRAAGSTAGVLSVEPSVFILRDVEGAGVSELRCELPLLGGSLEITLLPRFPRTGMALFALATVTTRSYEIDGWTITLEVLQPADTGDVFPALGILTVD